MISEKSILTKKEQSHFLLGLLLGSLLSFIGSFWVTSHFEKFKPSGVLLDCLYIISCVSFLCFVVVIALIARKLLKGENNKNKKTTSRSFKGKLPSYENIITIWKRMDESYWSSFHIFIILQGLLFAGYVQLTISETQIDIKILNLYCITGIVISIIWMFALHKKMAFIYLAEDVARVVEKSRFPGLKDEGFFTKSEKIFNDPKNEFLKQYFKSRYRLTYFPSSFLIAFVVPLVIILFWIGIIIVINGIIKI